MRIAILPNLKKDGAEDVSRKIIGLLKEKAYKAAVHKSMAEIFPEAEAEPDHDQLAKNCDIITYKYATGLEALIGFLELENNKERIDEIMNFILGE